MGFAASSTVRCVGVVSRRSRICRSLGAFSGLGAHINTNTMQKDCLHNAHINNAWMGIGMACCSSPCLAVLPGGGGACMEGWPPGGWSLVKFPRQCFGILGDGFWAAPGHGPGGFSGGFSAVMPPMSINLQI